MLIGSWSFVEIPRYLFYVFATLTSSDKIPGLLFFLRYSLFMILYPTGIRFSFFSFLEEGGAKWDEKERKRRMIDRFLDNLLFLFFF